MKQESDAWTTRVQFGNGETIYLNLKKSGLMKAVLVTSSGLRYEKFISKVEVENLLSSVID